MLNSYGNYRDTLDGASPRKEDRFPFYDCGIPSFFVSVARDFCDSTPFVAFVDALNLSCFLTFLLGGHNASMA